jgi:tetratricopeptide (TPR) repeat protein
MNQSRIQNQLDIALEHFRAGRKSDAWAELTNAREKDPNDPHILRFLAVLAAQSGSFPVALGFIRQAIASKPDDNFSYADLANMLGGSGETQKALKNYERSSCIAPDNAITFYNLGNLLRDLGRIQEAFENYDRATSRNPLDCRPTLNKGLFQRQSGDLLGAIQTHKNALSLVPFEVNNMEALAGSLRASGHPSKGLNWYWRTLFIHPYNPSTLINLSDLLNEVTDPAATHLASRAICLEPQDVRSYVNRGISLQRPDLPEGAVTIEGLPIPQGPDPSQKPLYPEYIGRENQRYQDALQSHDRALLLSAVSPEAHLNRGTALMELNRFPEALVANGKAISLRPELAIAYVSLTLILEEISPEGDHSRHLEHAIALNPDDPDGHFLIALVRLSQGRFEEGWQHYQWRWHSKIAGQRLPDLPHPSWNGKTTEGRLWVWPEQGIGDQILYGRCLETARRQVDSVLASLDLRLIPLFARSFPGIAFFPKEKISKEQYDQQIALGDLPRHVLKGGPETLPEYSKGYLKSDAMRTLQIRKSFGEEGKILCGIAWQSKRKITGSKKSVTLEDLKPLLSMDRFVFVSLQYGEVSDQINQFYSSCGIRIKECDTVDTFWDIDGLASLIDACDVIISTNNSTAHLAGALGKETHILLPSQGRSLFWYWKNRRRGWSTWYPSLRLYPKDPQSGWAKPLADIQSNLRTRFFSS